MLGIPSAAAASTGDPETVRLDRAVGHDRVYMKFNQWEIRWTGWKSACDNIYLVGQWLAWAPTGVSGPDGKRFAYSSVPGGCNWYNPGGHFDINVKRDEGQDLISAETPASVVRRMKRDALDRLIKFLSQESDPAVQPTNPTSKPIHNPNRLPAFEDGANQCH